MSSRTQFSSTDAARAYGYDDHGADKGNHRAGQKICMHCGERERYTRKCYVCKSEYDCRICLGCDDENGRND